ncbi:M23 family metallopeptidase [Sphingorhabdus soli]|uniref:M23 family metallopeptidase n=1 Tax=Flavisphingopyxis soli TaxID=2601267 RepID=A0A5C6U8V7_9SPHN|nr:M23 family metallopeptidase [Sphingorhabdus soli]TXC69224.1 M23 family metallopeptidase [Sphingorhabdus soli]
MNDATPGWRQTTKTIAVTAVVTSALWIVAGAYLYVNSGGDFGVAGSHGDAVAPTEAAAPAAARARPAPSNREPVYPSPSGRLTIPVAGVRPGDLVDTFTQARAGGERVHDAIDIMAADGTPVVAAAPGTVEKLYFSEGGGGITAYIRSPDRRWMYYYAHLEAYDPNLKEGDSISRGAPIGLVGHSGNASAEGPHLHFAINRMEQGEDWWAGTPVNPYPLLTR